MQVVLATHNRHKVEEMQQLLVGSEIILVPLPGSAPEPIEDGDSFLANARIKARAAAQLTKLPALADDSGICIDALDGQPGIFSARWAGPGSGAAEWIAKSLALLNGVASERRTARYVCALSLVDANGLILAESEGTFEGRIADTAAGVGGFGYDPIFLVGPEFVQTVAEISIEEKHARSHRGAAVRALLSTLALISPGGTS
jgi:XTP/dITP diphosphohydrolase